MRAGVLLVFVVLLQACASAPPRPSVSVEKDVFAARDWNVAVLDLNYAEVEPGHTGVARYQSAGPDAGRLIANLLAGELAALENVTIVERGELQNLVGEQELQMSGMISADSAVRIGEMLGADAVVVGDVSEYVTWTSVGVFGSTVSFSMRMIDVRTGRLLASGSISKIGNYLGAFENAQNLTRELVAGLQEP